MTLGMEMSWISLLTSILRVSLLKEIAHFMSVTSCDSLPLTRLEGLKELTRQLHDNKGQIRELLKECHGMMRRKMVYT